MVSVGSLLLGLTGLAQGQAENLYVPKTSFDAGNVRQGDVVEHAFPVRNPGRSTLTVGIIALSHPGMKVRMPPQLRTGETGRVTITWDTRLVQGETTVQALLSFNETESAIVSLKGNVIPPVEILPYPAVFISGFRGEEVTRVLEVLNHDVAPINVIDVRREDPHSTGIYSVTLKTIETGQRYQLHVELKSDAPAGRSTDVLQIQTDSPRSPAIRVPVNVFVKEDVYINPETVDFGVVRRQASQAWSPETFMLKTRHHAVRVLSVASDLPFLRLSHAGEDSASTHEIRVELQGNPGLGRFSGHIVVRTDDPSFPEVKAPVEGEIIE